MSFTMTHLIIAESISEIFDNHALSLPQYYLGSIAPDAVHNRENYISDFKKNSHLITDDNKWAMVTNNDNWINNVASFLKKHKNSEHYDFILGYCCHILTDIYNNINVWTPFRIKNAVGADIVLFPEMWSNGYLLTDIMVKTSTTPVLALSLLWSLRISKSPIWDVIKIFVFSSKIILSPSTA